MFCGAVPAGMFVDPVPAEAVLSGPEVHPGFGVVTLCRNGVEVERDAKGERDLPWWNRLVGRRTVPPESPVWTLHIDAPFESTVYALTGPRTWTLIDRKPGFE